MFQILTGTDNPILRRKSEEVTSEELPKYAQLGKQMVAYITETKNQSVGLAGPQIGVSKQIIAVHLLQNYEDEAFRSLCLINPKITYASKKLCSDTEGCLSVPG